MTRASTLKDTVCVFDGTLVECMHDSQGHAVYMLYIRNPKAKGATHREPRRRSCVQRHGRRRREVHRNPGMLKSEPFFVCSQFSSKKRLKNIKTSIKRLFSSKNVPCLAFTNRTKTFSVRYVDTYVPCIGRILMYQFGTHLLCVHFGATVLLITYLLGLR